MKLQTLYSIKDNILAKLAKVPEGEQWHRDYKKHKDIFKQILKLDDKWERDLFRVFGNYAERVDELVDWADYSLRLNKKQSKFSLVTNDDVWRSFNQDLQKAISDGFEEGMDLGGEYTIREQAVAADWRPTDPAPAKWLKSYSLDLVSRMNAVTKARLRASLVKSLDLGESQEEATNRLLKIVKDRRRAAMIAHTETVRSFTQGRLQILESMEGVYKYKIWRDGQSGACKRCKAIHGQKREHGTDFIDNVGGVNLEGPPMHPNCRCGMKIEIIEKPARKDFEKEAEVSDVFDWGDMRSGTKKKQREAILNHVQNRPQMDMGVAEDFDWEVRTMKTEEIEGFVEVAASSRGEATVSRYATDMQKGDKFPPIMVVELGTDQFIWDGNHRFNALLRLGAKKVPVLFGKPK